MARSAGLLSVRALISVSLLITVIALKNIIKYSTAILLQRSTIGSRKTNWNTCISRTSDRTTDTTELNIPKSIAGSLSRCNNNPNDALSQIRKKKTAKILLDLHATVSCAKLQLFAISVRIKCETLAICAITWCMHLLYIIIGCL